MKKITLSFMIILISVGINAQITTLIEWNFDTDLEGWSLKPELDGNVVNGILQLNANDEDPYMFSPVLNILAEQHTQIMVRMKNHTSSNFAQVFFVTTANPIFTGASVVDFTTVPNDTGFTDYYIEMTMNDNWEGTVTQIRLDPGLSGDFEIDFIRVRGVVCEPQSIEFNEIETKMISDPPFDISAIANSGLNINYTLLSGPAVLSDNTVTLTGEQGYVVLAANQSGDSTYCSAREALQSFYVLFPDQPTVSPQINTDGDQWVAIDGLERELPQYEDVGDIRSGKYVGIFYFLWHGNHGTDRILDLTKIIQENPNAPEYGGQYEFHWWGESEDGYYRADDPWVIRRQLEMLSAAGVDFLYIDVTNGFNYFSTVGILCEVAQDMRIKGIETPYISFVTKSNSGSNMNQIYDEFYALEKYKDLWFIWEGKPLIFGVTEDSALRTDVRNFFTIRYSWYDTDTETSPNHWQELDEYPQNYGWDDDINIPTQMVVGKALFPIHQLKGESFQNGLQPDMDQYKLTEFTGQGRHFIEQFDWALEVDPEIIMITGWNEWMAQKQISIPTLNPYFLGQPTNEGDPYFVDSYNQEFNRDIAPMKDGHTDNHYYLMTNYIRRFKGMSPPAVFSASQSIDMDGKFTEWESVTPIFKDYEGDIAHRNSLSFANELTYINTTGRNDIIESRSIYDNNNIYFYVKTAQTLTSRTDPNWMLLFIDTDQNKVTGWEGYDYVVNYTTISATQTTLKKWDGSTWGDEQAIEYFLNGNEMELKIPRNAIELNSGIPEFYFHWADNPQHLDNISAFFTDGDSAPGRRYNYNYSPSSNINSNEISNSNKQKSFVFPNPTKNTLHILTNGDVIEKVMVYDMQGKVIYIDNKPFAEKKSINVQSWESGIVFLQLIGKERVLTKKIIIE